MAAGLGKNDPAKVSVGMERVFRRGRRERLQSGTGGGLCHRRSAPPEKAGAASGISETTAEFGGALGIAVLGSIGTAVYRGEVADVVSEGIPPDVVACLELISTRSTA